MRFGISLTVDGPLSQPSAVAAVARAAEQLGYATVWSAWAGQLAEVAAVTRSPDLGWVWDGLAGDGVEGPRALRGCRRLRAVSTLPGRGEWVRAALPGVRRYDDTDDPGLVHDDAGWAPTTFPGFAALVAWRRQHPLTGLVVRWDLGPPTPVEVAELVAAGVSELVVAPLLGAGLDRQLRAYADVAEAVLVD